MSVVLANPFYAIELDLHLLSHESIVSEDQWIATNIEIITELGPESYFRYLIPGATATHSSLPCKLALSTAVDGEMGTISTGTLRLGVETEDRLEGLLAVTALAAKAGAPVFRVHEVEETRLTLEMIAGIVGESSYRVVWGGLSDAPYLATRRCPRDRGRRA
jgi:hypothetical protein